MRWLYGSSDEQVAPVVQSQNPHVKQLAEVLGNPAALKKLEANNSLADAYQELDPRAKKFMHSLLAAMDNATDAQKYLDGYDGDKALREYGERLMKVSRNIHSVMEATLVSKVDP
jgi:hypothetical protein